MDESEYLILMAAILGVLMMLALIPANIAKGKGHSFGGYWLFGICFFLPALIVALVIQDKSPTADPYAGHLQVEQRLSVQLSGADQIRELKDLLDVGAITYQEFGEKKEAVLRIKENGAPISEDNAYGDLRALKGLLDENVISPRDYELRKALLLGYEAEEDREIREAVEAVEADRTRRYKEATQAFSLELAESRAKILQRLGRS